MKKLEKFKKDLKIENKILKYFNKKRFTKNLLIEYIEMLQDYNQLAKKEINYYESKYKEKY